MRETEPKTDKNGLKTCGNVQNKHDRPMSDYIDRQAAISKFEPWLKVNGYSEGELNMLKGILYELKFLPSAQPYTEAEIQKMQDLEQSELEKAFELGREDALSEIVRCKDCDNWDTAWYPKGGGHFCYMLGLATDQMFYCAFAERRE